MDQTGENCDNPDQSQHAEEEVVPLDTGQTPSGDTIASSPSTVKSPTGDVDQQQPSEERQLRYVEQNQYSCDELPSKDECHLETIKPALALRLPISTETYTPTYWIDEVQHQTNRLNAKESETDHKTTAVSESKESAIGESIKPNKGVFTIGGKSFGRAFKMPQLKVGAKSKASDSDVIEASRQESQQKQPKKVFRKGFKFGFGGKHSADVDLAAPGIGVDVSGGAELPAASLDASMPGVTVDVPNAKLTGDADLGGVDVSVPEKKKKWTFGFGNKKAKLSGDAGLKADVAVPSVSVDVAKPTLDVEMPGLSAEADVGLPSGDVTLAGPSIEASVPAVEVPSGDVKVKVPKFSFGFGGKKDKKAAASAKLEGPDVDVRGSKPGGLGFKFGLGGKGLTAKTPDLSGDVGLKADLDVPSVSIDVAKPKLDVELPSLSAGAGIDLPSGDVSLSGPSVDVKLPDASIELPKAPGLDFDVGGGLSGDVHVPSAELSMSSPDVDLSLPSLSVDVPKPSINVDLPVVSADADVSLPSGDVTLSGPSIDAAIPSVELPSGDVSVTKPKFGFGFGGTKAKVKGPAVDVDVGDSKRRGFSFGKGLKFGLGGKHSADVDLAAPGVGVDVSGGAELPAASLDASMPGVTVDVPVASVKSFKPLKVVELKGDVDIPPVVLAVGLDTHMKLQSTTSVDTKVTMPVSGNAGPITDVHPSNKKHAPFHPLRMLCTSKTTKRSQSCSSDDLNLDSSDQTTFKAKRSKSEIENIFGKLDVGDEPSFAVQYQENEVPRSQSFESLDEGFASQSYMPPSAIYDVADIHGLSHPAEVFSTDAIVGLLDDVDIPNVGDPTIDSGLHDDSIVEVDRTRLISVINASATQAALGKDKSSTTPRDKRPKSGLSANWTLPRLRLKPKIHTEQPSAITDGNPIVVTDTPVVASKPKKVKNTSDKPRKRQKRKAKSSIDTDIDAGMPQAVSTPRTNRQPFQDPESNQNWHSDYDQQQQFLGGEGYPYDVCPRTPTTHLDTVIIPILDDRPTRRHHDSSDYFRRRPWSTTGSMPGCEYINDDHLFPNALTPTKIPSFYMSNSELYDVPYMDDKALPIQDLDWAVGESRRTLLSQLSEHSGSLQRIAAEEEASTISLDEGPGGKLVYAIMHPRGQRRRRPPPRSSGESSRASTLSGRLSGWFSRRNRQGDH